MPTKEVDGTKKTKLILEWNKELEFANLNFKALGTLTNGLTQTEFYKIMNITYAKNLWDYLEVTLKVQVKWRKVKLICL